MGSAWQGYQLLGMSVDGADAGMLCWMCCWDIAECVALILSPIYPLPPVLVWYLLAGGFVNSDAPMGYTPDVGDTISRYSALGRGFAHGGRNSMRVYVVYRFGSSWEWRVVHQIRVWASHRNVSKPAPLQPQGKSIIFLWFVKLVDFLAFDYPMQFRECCKVWLPVLFLGLGWLDSSISRRFPVVHNLADQCQSGGLVYRRMLKALYRLAQHPRGHNNNHHPRRRSNPAACLQTTIGPGPVHPYGYPQIPECAF